MKTNYLSEPKFIHLFPIWISRTFGFFLWFIPKFIVAMITMVFTVPTAPNRDCATNTAKKMLHKRTNTKKISVPTARNIPKTMRCLPM